MRSVCTILGWMLALAAIFPAKAVSPAILATENSVQLGIAGGFGTYEENVRPQDTEAGALFGFQAGLSALRPTSLSRFGWPDLYASIGYDFSAGYLTYSGNLAERPDVEYSARDNSYFNAVVVRLGLGRAIAENAEIIPFIAGGYQNWYRNVAGPAGFNEFYQAGVLGAGLKIDVAATPLLVVSAAAEGLAVIGGSVVAPSQSFEGDFGTSAEERVSLDADYRLSDSWHAFAGLGVSHYAYSGSKPGATGLYEPLSTTLQVNSIVGLAYGF
jgi:hypothetical protein